MGPKRSLQHQAISPDRLYEGLDWLFAGDPGVFVAGYLRPSNARRNWPGVCANWDWSRQQATLIKSKDFLERSLT
ncbi:MAG: hypothetical protein KME03_09775 [Aphanocapsa lilacina HA4352-LM1]|jgi:hypothetical protein|nr:hypothetical protein [Aphanocapsa lilacina HA4352-LM1]